MDDFLAKPIQVADLWAAIERVVGTGEVGRLKDEKKKSAAADSFILPTASFGESLLDPRVVLAACGGDAVILERIGQAFQACLPEQVAAVRDALCQRDAPRLREAAHLLSGMVAVFSTVVGEVASDLEDQAARGQLEAAPALVEQLEVLSQELLREAGGLSLETLRQQREAAGDHNQTTSHPNNIDPA
jgi:hypothetical protein